MELVLKLPLFYCILLSITVYYVTAQSYKMPEPHFQARSGGGFRAYMPDGECDMENFEFQYRRNNNNRNGFERLTDSRSNSSEIDEHNNSTEFEHDRENNEPDNRKNNSSDFSEWVGGNVSNPNKDGYWMYENKNLTLEPGENLKYRARVRRQGRDYNAPEDEWKVPELVDDFSSPPFDKRQQECNREKKKPPSRQPERENMPEEPSTRARCPWADVPRRGDTREVMLEKQLVGLQCEMSAFMDRSSRLQYQLTQELTDLKKLNYAAVARMQRLESLIRSIPRSYPQYPFI